MFLKGSQIVQQQHKINFEKKKGFNSPCPTNFGTVITKTKEVMTKLFSCLNLEPRQRPNSRELGQIYNPICIAVSQHPSIEYQRDEAIQNLIEMQDTWEDYQRRSKDRNRKLESCEDDLRDALTSVTQERDDLLEQLNDMQGTVASQEAQIK